MMAKVNQDLCISCALCVDVCPKVFSFNDANKSEAIDADIPNECIDTAKDAAYGCPVDAISLF